jgi:hypothetical protein
MSLQSRHDVVSTIADATGIAGLQADAHDNFEIVIGARYSCFFHLPDDDRLVLDMAVRVARMDNQTDQDVLAQMLRANTLSASGRFALEPGTGRAFWGQRLEIVEHSRESLVAAIKDFLRSGVELGARLDRMMDAADQARAARNRAVSDDTMIRL